MPKALDPSRRYPLVVSLHGAWSNHRINLRRVFGRGSIAGSSFLDGRQGFPRLPDVDFIVACPLARGTMGYQGLPESDVYEMMREVKRRFPIDEDRVYLTGLSVGGGGALWLGLTRPDVWAGVAAVCPAVPPGTEELAGNALNFPVHLFQGEDDPVVGASVTRAWHKRLLDAGVKTEYIEYPDVRHNSWDLAYKDGAIFRWFSQHRRTAHPAHVRFSSRSYRYRAAWWVQLDRFPAGTLASIDAEFTQLGSLRIQTSNLEAFTLALAGHPQAATAIWNVEVDRRPFKIQRTAKLAFHKEQGAWNTGPSAPPLNEKSPGLEGPIAEGFSARHIYVYGTRGAEESEVRFRREQAMRVAEWSSAQNRLLLSPLVMPDRELNLEDEANTNLILIGSKETNSVLARFAARLPLELNAGAADYGLMFVAPVEGRYVVVNSGLPFTTGIEAAKRPGLDFLPPAWRAILSFGDYVLFRGSLEHVVAEGRFDRNWKMPPADAAAMKSTGAVNIR